MSTLYLHIGPPKTGTTSIQNFLWDNRGVLETHGICFPDLGYRYPDIDFRRNGHFLVRNKPSEGQEVSHFEEGLGKIEELARQYDSIILSDEGLWKDGYRKKRFWTRLAKGLKEKQLDLRIIVYLRRQDLWVQSFWAQKIKVGKTALGFQEYLRFIRESGYPLDYCAYMDLLSGWFGKEALIIRIMEKEQFRGAEHTLLSDFLDIFGLSLSDGFTEQQKIYNPKFSGTYLELKRILNRLPWFSETRGNIFNGSLLKVQELNPFHYNPEEHSFFAPGEQQLFRDSFAGSNSRLAGEYLGRENGILFEEAAEDPPSMAVTDQDLLRDTILVYGNVIQTLHQNVREKSSLQQESIRTLQKNMNALSKELKLLSDESKSLRKSLEANSFRGRLKRVRNRLRSAPHLS